jgi:hypothetical protein
MLLIRSRELVVFLVYSKQRVERFRAIEQAVRFNNSFRCSGESTQARALMTKGETL